MVNLSTDNYTMELAPRNREWYRLESNKYSSEKIEFKIEHLDEVIMLLIKAKEMLQ